MKMIGLLMRLSCEDVIIGCDQYLDCIKGVQVMLRRSSASSVVKRAKRSSH